MKTTKSKNIIIDNIKGRKPAQNENEIVAYRGQNFKKLKSEIGLIKDLEEYRMIGNPFGLYGLVKMDSPNGEATDAFWFWLTGFKYKELYQNYRDLIWSKKYDFKGLNIIYYKELGRPSHATALDYFLNYEKQFLIS